MNALARLSALLAEPDFVVMPAVWDGLTAKLTAAAGFNTAFLSGSCVAASRLGGPDLDLISFAEMHDSFNMVHGTDRILGAYITGPDAGTLIAELATAMKFGTNAENMDRGCHAHPSLSEAVKEAALAGAGRALHI